MDWLRRLSITSGLTILIGIFLIFSLFCNSINIDTSFQHASGQSGNTASKNKSNDRIVLTSDDARKLRQVPGERGENQYIVVLKGDNVQSSAVRSVSNESRNEGALLRHLYYHAIKGFSIRVPNDRVLDAILKNPRVDYVQPDLKVNAFSQTLPTGVDRVDGDLSVAKSGDGSGTLNVDIAILDTGIDLTHPDLNVYKQTTFVSGTSSGNDDEGHGTSVAGITAAKDDTQGVVGMAPGARLWSVKVLDKNGQGFDSDIIAGIDYVTQNAGEIDVVNLSFGGDGKDEALHTAISNSMTAGVTYVAAAGNEGKDAASVIPGSFPEVIAVSAIGDTDGKCGGQSSTSTSAGKDDTFASFSNYGSVVDIAAPGVLVKTTSKGGSYTTFSGTSASAPYVTGAAALYKAYHNSASPAEVRNALMDAGSKQSTTCDGKGHGYFKGDPDGNPEPLLYVGSTNSLDTTPPAQVTGLSVSSVSSSTQLNVAWTNNAESDLDHYIIYRGTTSGFSVSPGTTTPTGTSTTNSYSSTGLNPSTTYYYRVAAVDKAGNIGLPSSEKFGTTPGTSASTPKDTNPPPKVTGLSVKKASSTQLNLKWAASKTSDLDLYNIYRSTKSKFTVILGTTPAIGTSITNSYQSTGLHSSTKYYYKVAAVDKAGNIGKLSITKNGKTKATSSFGITNEDPIGTANVNSGIKTATGKNNTAHNDVDMENFRITSAGKDGDNKSSDGSATAGPSQNLFNQNKTSDILNSN